MQNPGIVLNCVLRQIHGFVYVLHFHVQYTYEDLLHLFDNIHHLPHEI